MKDKLRVLFVTRKFLPSVGGMEIAATCLYRELEKRCETKLIKVNGGKKFLPLALPLTALKGIWHARRWKPDVVLLQDVVMATLAPFLKKASGSTVAIAHGLDVTFDNLLYQRFVVNSLRECDAVVCISTATREECRKRGLDGSLQMPVIPYAVEDLLLEDEDRGLLREELSERLNLDCRDRLILLTVGRLVKRKGVAWFCEHCLPDIAAKYPDVLYLVVGEGEMRDRIASVIRSKNLASNVLLFGKASKKELKLFYNTADIFVMPNIRQPGDMEGLGLVALEASTCKLPVVASNLEGIKDALSHGGIGILVEPGDSKGFEEAISELANDPDKRRRLGEAARDFVISNFTWENTTRDFIELFLSLNGKQ